MRFPFRHAVACVTCLVFTTACSQAVAPEAPEVGEGRAAELTTEAPAPLPLTSPAPAADAAVDPAGDGVDPGDGATATPTPPPASGDEPAASPSPAPAGDDAPPAPAASPARSAPRTLLALADRTGDHGARGPAWADLTGVELVGGADAFTLTARFAGALPGTVPEDEVMLVAFDLGQQDEEGNGYQLFVTGNNANGWLAYFFVPGDAEPRPFPASGVFAIAGSTMTIGVPWNEIGSPSRGPLAVRAEWSRDEGGLLGALNPASEDRLDGQPHTFDRTA